VLGHLQRQAHQQAAALGGAQLAPGPFEALARRLHRRVDVFGVPRWMVS
jgi:hypothetical protein